jgi:5-methylcytosine-specific restriction endonuclease McrA
MKKYIPTQEELTNILKWYNEDLLGSHTISLKLGLSKPTILRILKENGVKMNQSGRRFIGGKKVADKKWRGSNKEYMSKKSKVWYEQNKEHRKEYMKEYRKKNIDKIRETKRNYEKTRKTNDPLYKLINNFRTAIYQVLKERNIQKNGHYFDILKYTPEQLIEHLESKFTGVITWDNYGQWHVDHIIPISSFDIKEIGDKEFNKCWALENLQPLWGDENIRKSNKIVY